MHSAAGLNASLPKLAKDQGQFVFMPLLNHTREHCERTMTTSSGSPRPGCFDSNPGAFFVIIHNSYKSYLCQINPFNQDQTV